MANCPECPEEGLPEWIMSYADMITILMAFFVVMYSMAGSKDSAKEQAVLKSFREQFGPQWAGMTALGPGPYVKADSPMARLATAGSREKGNNKKGEGSKKLRPVENRQPASLRPGDQPSVGGTIYFPDDSTQVTAEQEKALQGAVNEIGGKALKIEVRGHTSRRNPPDGDKYRDNWDLAYERARNVMKYLVSQGIDPRRIRLAVAADNEPLNGNVNPVARGKGARVEIFMLNELMDSATDAKRTPLGGEPSP